MKHVMIMLPVALDDFAGLMKRIGNQPGIKIEPIAEGGKRKVDEDSGQKTSVPQIAFTYVKSLGINKPFGPKEKEQLRNLLTKAGYKQTAFGGAIQQLVETKMLKRVQRGKFKTAKGS